MEEGFELSGPVMGFDPGKVNFAWATYDGGLLLYGDMEGADEIQRLPSFRERLRRKLDMRQPGAVFTERYQLRMGGGAVVNMELVNLMNGIIIEACIQRGIYVELVMAATHKSWTSRNYTVQKRPTKKKNIKGEITEKYDLGTYEEWVGIKSDHEIDAANMAKYGYHKIVLEGEP
jgi:hypothetical protein